MIVVPSMNAVRKGIIIGSTINLGRGLNGFSMGRKLNRSLGLPTTNTRVVGTPQLVFTNQIMTTHAHKTINQPPMSSIAIERYRNTNAEDPKKGIKNHLS